MIDYSGKCDFCFEPVGFRRVMDNYRWWLVPVAAGSGSDYLATWCADCGARGEHNANYQAFRSENPRAVWSDWKESVSA